MKLSKGVLTPEDGKYLTQVAEVGDNNRIYSKELWLGKADSKANWREADEAEKAEFEERMKPKETKPE